MGNISNWNLKWKVDACQSVFELVNSHPCTKGEGGQQRVAVKRTVEIRSRRDVIDDKRKFELTPERRIST